MVEGFWKTRDNGGKAAWLFIGVLSSVYWISDVITDDELAALIIRACSSRNLFIKHHLSSRIDTVHKNWSQTSRKRRKHIEHDIFQNTIPLCRYSYVPFIT